MNHAQLLLAVILLQQGLYGVVWAIAARLNLSPGPARHWAAATWLTAGGMCLILMRGTLPLWLTLGVANWLLIAALVVLRRGIQLFAGLPPSDREHLGVTAVSALALTLSLFPARAMPIVMVTSAALSWTLCRCGIETYESLSEEFGRATARWCALPTMAIGLLLLVRAIVAFALGDQVLASAATSGFSNAGMVFASLTFGLVINTTLFAMTVIRLVRKLQHQSDHDFLTDLLNRRAMERLMDDEVKRQRRGAPGFAVLSIDVDHFKHINDVYGHPVGDVVLQKVALALRGAAREVDRVARMGGEEFYVLLPGQNALGAERVARRVMDVLRGVEGPEQAPSLRVTVSIGVAVSRPGANEPLDVLMHRLDEALMTAKEQGRNRIVHAAAEGDAVPVRAALARVAAGAGADADGGSKVDVTAQGWPRVEVAAETH